MFQHSARAALVCGAVVLSLSCGASAQDASLVQLWVAPSAMKVRPLTPAPAGSSPHAQLFAAKNEFEAFHAVVTGAATAVSMSLSSLSDGQGHTISGRDIVLYREALINVTVPSGGDGAAGLWPDALVPDVDPIVGEKRNAFPFDVPAGQSRAVFVDIHVPAAAAAGIYTGTLSVTSNGAALGSITIALTVWDFAVPSTSTLKSAFGLAWNTTCGAHFNDWSCTDWNRAWALRSRYLRAALDNHISIETPTLNAPVDPTGVQSWGEYDAYIGPLLDGTAPTRLVGARLTSVRMQTASGVVTTAAARGWSSHFRAKGWFGSLFNYACDEPPLTCQFNEIDGRINAVTAADAAIPNLVTTSIQRAQANGVKNISLYTPVLNWMDDKTVGTYPGSQRGLYGGDVWWYQGCMSFGCSGLNGGYGNGSASYETGWPSYAVDTDATRNRAMEWMSFSYGLTGELYYETTFAYTNGDAWNNQYAFGGTGDGTLFYPGTPAKIGGTTDIPIESLRLKGIRDGMEDYELLNMARHLGLLDQAMQISRAVFPRTFDGVTTPATIDGARAQLAGLILHALGKDPQPPPDAGSPDAGPADAGAPDAGPVDAGTPDAGTPGPGTPDAGTPDAGTAPDSDAGTPPVGDGGTPPTADAGTPAPDAGSTPPIDPQPGTTVSVAGFHSPFGQGGAGAQPNIFGTGCSSRGNQPGWLALPVLLLAIGIQRRRRRIL